MKKNSFRRELIECKRRYDIKKKKRNYIVVFLLLDLSWLVCYLILGWECSELWEDVVSSLEFACWERKGIFF